MGVVTWLCRVIHTSISTKATEELRGLKFSCWSCSRLKALPTIQLLSQQQHKAQEHGGSVGSKRHIWIRRVNRFAATPKPGPSHPLPHWILAHHHKEGKWFLQREEKNLLIEGKTSLCLIEKPHRKVLSPSDFYSSLVPTYVQTWLVH